MRSEYGRFDVWCPFSEQVEFVHRPAGSSDPFFCHACGSTEHEPLPANPTTSAPEIGVDISLNGDVIE